MKVIIKCGGDPTAIKEMKNYFLEKLYPDSLPEIDIEFTEKAIFRYQKNDKQPGRLKPTAQIFVQLPEDVLSLVLESGPIKLYPGKISQKYVTEAEAIQQIEEDNPSFEREYFSYRISGRR